MADPKLSPQQVEALQNIGALTGETAEQILAKKSSTEPTLEEELASAAAAPQATAERPIQSSMEQPMEEMQAESVKEQPVVKPSPESGGDKFQQIKRRLEREAAAASPSGVLRREISDEEVISALEAEEQANQAAIQQKESELRAKVDQRRSQLERAQRLGLQLPPNPELDQLLFQEDIVKATTGLSPGEAPASEMDAKAAQTPSISDVNKAAEPIRAEMAENIARQEIADARIKEEQDKQAKLQKELMEEEEKVSKIDPNRFWKNQTTGQKIGLVLTAMLQNLATSGTAQAFSGSKRLIEMVNRDIEQQRLDQQEEMAKKQFALKQLQFDLDRKSQAITDQKSLLGIDKLKLDIANEQARLMESRLRAKQLREGGLQSTEGLSKEQADRAVRLPNGKLALADNKASADDLRKFNAEVDPGIQGIERILKLAKDASRFSLEDRAKVSAEMGAIIGNLRIPFFGPGVMTDREYDRLRSTLGDPNALLAFPTVERTKLRTVLDKLKSDRRTRFQQSGITVPKSKREKLIEHNLKKKAGNIDQIENAIDAMIEKGQLPEDFKR